MGILVVFCLVETLGLKETVVSSCCLLHLTSQSCFLEDDSYPYDPGISLPAVSYRTDLQLHYILVLPKVVRKVITNFYLRYLVLIFFPMLILRNCELLYILADFLIFVWKNLVSRLLQSLPDYLAHSVTTIICINKFFFDMSRAMKLIKTLWI